MTDLWGHYGWRIETLFSALKTRGFNLESTHFRHADRGFVHTDVMMMTTQLGWHYRIRIKHG
ncbi:hypothetical protein GFS31_42090 (plasmid) [Leptolyngbya sp. BL0902]|uniref:hypothetical protein n=1 Tax=Leptolyngbya sp. BL0902 TaxID=1115757 RepID=UPI0018E78718|nr:hypothetical protein [Leptolyngbya sp. BL0902]QQE67496.1 hypothetical protein GFS31_42090 [Leptolyngbya sp. BL0902]